MSSHDDPEPVDSDPDEPDEPPRRRRIGCVLRLVVVVMGVLAVAVVLFVVVTRNPEPGPFYTPPDDLAGEPGSILRSEPFDTGLPDGARGWLVLYRSTDEDGDPIAVSGLVVAPEEPPDGPRPVLAWAHGTTGIARACAPSLSDAPLEGIPDLSGPLDQGWVVVLTDYPGLGTPGPHPYLVGASEGRAVLDSVRAAHDLDTRVELDDQYAIWGHSQGGHAALFAGQLAPDYLPDLDLAGVAAFAPATRLEDNLAAVEGTRIGHVLTILAVEAWSRYYPDITTDILTSRARRPAERIARNCINQPSRYRLLVEGVTLPDSITDHDVGDDPVWSGRLDENTPDPTGIAAPLFVGQGLADEIIAPAVTEAWATDRCAAHAPMIWRTYPDVGHPAIVGPAGRDALTWTVDQFAGAPTADSCPTS